jgi:predicted phosphodiesterase
MRVAVIGDVHANALALQAALTTADIGGYDQLVLLGDLLTYGVDVVETLELVSERLATGHAVLLRGNHDSLYQNLLEGETAYYDKLPVWIKESVMWTFDRLPLDIWPKISFNEEFQLLDFLFSHANPYGSERWEYLNSSAEHANAAESLIERGFRVGVFGHTHRSKWYRYFSVGGGFESSSCGELDHSAVHILNAGAIGQSRDNANPVANVLWLNVTNNYESPPSFKLQQFNWNIAGHLNRVAVSGMSDETLTRIASFFNHNY